MQVTESREGAVLNTFNQYHIFHISFEASTSFSFSCGEGAALLNKAKHRFFQFISIYVPAINRRSLIG